MGEEKVIILGKEIEKEKKPAPKRMGIYPPIKDPKTMPIVINDFADILKRTGYFYPKNITAAFTQNSSNLTKWFLW